MTIEKQPVWDAKRYPFFGQMRQWPLPLGSVAIQRGNSGFIRKMVTADNLGGAPFFRPTHIYLSETGGPSTVTHIFLDGVSHLIRATPLQAIVNHAKTPLINYDDVDVGGEILFIFDNHRPGEMTADTTIDVTLMGEVPAYPKSAEAG